jgi:two-component system, NarL family, invasion response regulator UvrY
VSRHLFDLRTSLVIRVLIADDHAIVRQGLKQILAETQDMVVAGEAETSVEAVKLARETEWDVALLDISMPDRSGIDTLKLIKRERPKLPILILSMHPEDHYAVRCLKAGASGYLTKQSAPVQLVRAIRQVASGRKYISPTVAEELANSIGTDLDQPAHAALSDREYQTLRLIATGHSLSEIAAQLSLSAKTVSVYRARLLEKLNLKNNADVAHYAVKNRLVD